MSQSRKHRGYRTERVIADYLRLWWDGASVGRGNGRDVINVPFDIEIKARTGLDIKGTLRQIESRTNESGLLGFAAFRLNGQGETPSDYVAMLRLGDLVGLLLEAGYKDKTTQEQALEPERCRVCGSWKFTNCACKTCALCKDKPNG